tara:strand:- start:93 stop:467 length:375 start_codon:yes stop_codon:yes gene_type:complete
MKTAEILKKDLPYEITISKSTKVRDLKKMTKSLIKEFNNVQKSNSNMSFIIFMGEDNLYSCCLEYKDGDVGIGFDVKFINSESAVHAILHAAAQSSCNNIRFSVSQFDERTVVIKINKIDLKVH